MIKVLHVVSSLGNGGVESVLYNYYSNMDNEKFCFDFITHGEEIGLFEKKFNSEFQECKIYHISKRRNHPIKSAFEAYKIFKNKEYKIIHFHGHIEVVPQLLAAIIAGKRIRIVHSHNPKENDKLSSNIKSVLLPVIFKMFATNCMACSHIAGDYAFNNFFIKNKNYTVLNNAIDSELFLYNKDLRGKIRSDLNLNNKFVIGNIARFSDQKNHDFLLEIFFEITKVNSNSQLLLIGEGENRADIEKKVERLNLNDKVSFLGVREDIPTLMQAMDLFLLPSHFEGLGVVLVEAQANGLHCFASKDVIPEEVKISNLLEFLPLSCSAKEWAQSCLKFNYEYTRNDISTEIIGARYDIKNQANYLEKIYERGIINHDQSFACCE